MHHIKLLTLFILCNVSNSALALAQNHTNTQKPNIIMVIADGMGPAYITAYRMLQNAPQSTETTYSVFDRHLVGAASTAPHPISGSLTDSAASATAMATGIKTYNKAIGVDVNKKPLLTVSAQAKQQGKKVGLVVTAPITDATPAAYFTQHESRKLYNDIADSYLHLLVKNDLDIALGGGSRYFLREDKNLVESLVSQGGHFINSYDQLATLSQNKPILGLFGEVSLPRAIDDKNPTRLVNMTKAAIKHLENEQGYFLLIEASLVDWSGHDKDIVSAMAEMNDLAHTLVWLESYLQTNPNTTVIITADHDTGGLTLSSNNKAWEPELINTIKQSPYEMGRYYLTLPNSGEIVDTFSLNLSTQDIAKLTDIKTQLNNKTLSAKKAHKRLFSTLVNIINEKTNTGWTTYGHTGVDVLVMAMGKEANRFKGMQDNTDIAKKIFGLLAEE